MGRRGFQGGGDAGPLITPTLFSHRPPPDREKREKGKDRDTDSNCYDYSHARGSSS